LLGLNKGVWEGTLLTLVLATVFGGLLEGTIIDSPAGPAGPTMLEEGSFQRGQPLEKLRYCSAVAPSGLQAGYWFLPRDAGDRGKLASQNGE